MDRHPPQPFKAALWMCGAIVSFTLMAVGGREIQVELNSVELMFWRSLIGWVIVIAILRLGSGGMAAVRSRHWGLHLTRNLFHFFGQNMWFYGLTLIPLSQLVALEFTMPIWVLVLAPLFLAEALSLRKLLIALVGFIGVLIVAQPGVQPLNLGHLAGLLAAIGFAVNLIFTRRIMQHDAVLTVLFWMTASQMMMGLILSLALGFTWPGAALLPWLAVVGVTGLTAHYSLTTALGLAPATMVAPMEFARLPIIALVGMVLYAEALNAMVFLGAAIIFAANFWNMRAPRTPARRNR